jgi:hypothetical protein
MAFLLAVTVLLIPMYAAGNMRWDMENVIITHLNMWMYYLAFEFFAQLAAVVSENILVSLMAVIVYWYQSFLFSGLMVNVDELWWPMKGLTYIMPTRYAMANQIYIEYDWTDRTIPGSLPCAPYVTNGVPNATLQAANVAAGCIYRFGPENPGFTCGVNEDQKQGCMGYTGRDVLQSLYGLGFKTMEPENNVWLFLMIIGIIAVTNKIGHIYFFVTRVRFSPKMEKPLVAKSAVTE